MVPFTSPERTRASKNYAPRNNGHRSSSIRSYSSCRDPKTRRSGPVLGTTAHVTGPSYALFRRLRNGSEGVDVVFETDYRLAEKRKSSQWTRRDINRVKKKQQQISLSMRSQILPFPWVPKISIRRQLASNTKQRTWILTQKKETRIAAAVGGQPIEGHFLFRGHVQRPSVRWLRRRWPARENYARY